MKVPRSRSPLIKPMFFQLKRRSYVYLVFLQLCHTSSQMP